ncbi:MULTISPECIES: malonate decarboxylase subunit epsilon [unclassified Acinetobacter]|uniref:malonate decarboxylase subunit epsilon n=1 Tax=unclassified Acinetobacter TaxID=196816 RepID=UPI0018ABFD4D|nr:MULTISPECIES: malonate decarboxylase subunit epsilon [unclassified Acinetobacter]MBJ9953069.1 malonate decarboxylase subunit epsilon [Acinetobacter baumannii]
MSSIWVFPGQGAQKPNMLHDLPQTTSVHQYFERASTILGQDVLLLDQQGAIQSTYAVQLCLYIAGVVSGHLLSEQQLKPDYVAGLSIGAWAAATVAEVLSFEDGLKLVARRATLMQDAYPTGYGMMALIRTDKSSVSEWVKEVQQYQPEVYVANINSANQIVISGADIAMQQVADIARQKGVLGKKLNVAVPSHCELLKHQAEILDAEVKKVSTSSPKIRYLSGTTARLLVHQDQIIDDITFNMSRVIDWESTVQSAWERGVRLHIEAWPGTVLTGLAKKVFTDGTVMSFQGTRLDTLIVEMQKEHAHSV